MTRVRSKRLFRVVAHLVVASLIAPMLAAPASAQLVETMTIGLADFTNKSGVLGDALSRLASGAVYMELNKSRRFDVITDSTMKTVMSDLGLKQPLSKTDLLRLGQELEADAMTEGEITSVVTSKDPRRVSVTLVIRMIDVASGELLNGAVVVGSSSPRVGYSADLDAMITEAVNNAAYLAVKTIVEYIIPEATVQNSIGTNDVMLNKGTRDGIRRGMKMVVLREKQGGGKEVVGRILVREADPNDAVASVLSAPKGVKPEDKVRAIYEMPGYKPSAEAKAAKGVTPARYERKGGSKKFLLGLLAALGLALMVKGGSGAENVGPATAESGVPPDIETASPGVRVTFDSSKLAHGLNVVQWKLYRDLNTIVATIDGAVAGKGRLYDDTGTKSGSYVKPAEGNGSTALTTGTISAPGLILGETHAYYVSAVYQVQQPGETAKTYFETALSFAGRATPLGRIPAADLVASTKGQADVDLRRVDFTWKSVKGANEYIVEATVETDPTFDAPRYVSAVKRTSAFSSGQSVVIENQNIASLFTDLDEGDKILWRVGAKNIGDRAGPVLSPERRYIYSEHGEIIVREQPPPPPNP